MGNVLDRVVLFAPETFNLAETTRCVEVARAMGPGIRCVFSGYSRRFAAVIEEAGFEFHLLEPELMSRLRPFAVVIGSTPSTFVSARSAGISLVYVKPYALTQPQLEAQATSGPRVGRLVAAATLRATYLPRAFRRVAARHGVPLPRHTVDALDGDLNLIASLDSWWGQVDLPPGYRAVGPISARLPGEVPDVVARARERGRPVMYVAMGSSGNRRNVLRTLRALRGRREERA